MTRIFSLTTLTALLLLVLPIEAQENGVNSPYTRFGIGRLSNRATGFNAGTAGVGYGVQNSQEINILNPASLGKTDSLSFIFDLGASVQASRLSDSKAKANHIDGTFDYLTAGFRAARNLGIAVSLTPFSSVGYTAYSPKSISEDYAHSGSVSATDTYKSEGGLHEVDASIGWAPTKYTAIGIQGGYLWGGITHSTSTTFSDASMPSTLRTYNACIRTFNARAGIQFYAPLNKTDYLTFGGTYTLGHKIHSDATMTTGTTSSVAKNAYELPHSIGVGASWEHKERLCLAADYELQKWGRCTTPWLKDATNLNSYEGITGLLRDSHRIAVGVTFTPLKKGANWKEYITYKAGFALTTPYAKIPNAGGFNNGPTSYLATAGVTLPIMNVFGARCALNLSAQYEHLRPAFAGQVKENYFRLCIGINFNEEWFSKWKVN